VASALAAMVQEDERGLGGWQAEWEIVPELVGLVGGALHHMTDALAGLRVDAARMRANLEATRGLVYSEAVEIALAGRVGRQDARRLVDAACRRARAEGRHLEEVLASDREVAPHLPASELEPLFDPLRALGSAERLVDGVLRRHDAGRGKPAAS
jgi:3-carboxy-cis,cis-muconate cycloisomerase